jgi:hypothetical protein
MWYSNLGKHLFIDTFSNNIEKLVPLNYQCVETHSIEVFWLLSLPLSHLRFNLFVISSCDRLNATNTSHRKRETFLYGYTLQWVLLPTENAQHNAAFRCYTSQARSPFWLLKPASEHAHARLLPRLSWSWTVLLPSDTYRKPISSITAVLLPFLTYLVTRSRIF